MPGCKGLRTDLIGRHNPRLPDQELHEKLPLNSPRELCSTSPPRTQAAQLLNDRATFCDRIALDSNFKSLPESTIRIDKEEKEIGGEAIARNAFTPTDRLATVISHNAIGEDSANAAAFPIPNNAIGVDPANTAAFPILNSLRRSGKMPTPVTKTCKTTSTPNRCIACWRRKLSRSTTTRTKTACPTAGSK
jgi:hypothetical protein